MVDVLFVNAQKEMALAQEVNGTLLLGSKLLQAGFDVEVLRFGQIQSYHQEYDTFIRDVTDRILEISPRCVSFYTLWPYFHVMLRVAAEVKKRAPHIYTVLGGPQSSATAKATMEAMAYIDMICTGEGEDTVVPFFHALLRQGGEGLETIPGLFYRKGGAVVKSEMDMPLCDLETLPRWDERLYLAAHDKPEPERTRRDYFMPIDAGRGCPYNCSFCCSSYFWRRTYRLKSPERIVADIRYFHDKFGIRSFWFSHDAFTTDRRLVSKVCDYIIEQGLDISWRCSARVDCLTEELVLKMKKAGMTEIEVGIETGSQRMQKLIHKNLDLHKARRMISCLLENKLRVSLFFMFGFPQETEEDLAQTLDLLFSLVDQGVQKADIFFCRFNPTTELTDRYLDQLVLDPEIKILSRAIFGYQEELEVIASHRELFPFFYHLDTPLRNEFQYLLYLVYLYQKFPNSAKYLRGLYGGDDLAFYRDFYRKNSHVFDRGTQYVLERMEADPLELFSNMMEGMEQPCIPQLKGLMRFVGDVQRVTESAEDITIRDTYSFSILDFKSKKPIEAYCVASTEMLVQKVHGKLEMRVLGLG